MATEVTGLTISTFGGNPVTATAAKAVLDFIEEHNLRANGKETGAYLRWRSEELKGKHEIIGDARGIGLCRPSSWSRIATPTAMSSEFRRPMNTARTDVDQFIEFLDHSLSACGATAFGKTPIKPRVTGTNIASTLTSSGTVPVREALAARI